jgi:aryl-alcohol dehydrogenase-like predicted oxidoreductase
MTANIPVGNATSMQFGTVANVKKQVSRLILGSPIFSPPDKNYAYSMLDEFVRLGGTTLETAHSYGDGDCERMIGRWVSERGLRDQITIITKGGHHFDLRQRIIPECITADMQESLARLQTDYIDIYMLHRDDPTRPVDEIVECLDAHKKAGRIRAYGGSNWTAARIQEANDFARKRNLTPFVVGSPHFSLAVPHQEPWPGCIWLTDADRCWYEKNDVALISWSSQARGFFARQTADNENDTGVLKAWLNDSNLERLKRAKTIAADRGISANAVALAYVLAQKFNTFAAIGPVNFEEMHDSFSALGYKLTEDEMKWLNLESDQVPDAKTAGRS